MNSIISNCFITNIGALITNWGKSYNVVKLYCKMGQGLFIKKDQNVLDRYILLIGLMQYKMGFNLIESLHKK